MIFIADHCPSSALETTHLPSPRQAKMHKMSYLHTHVVHLNTNLSVLLSSLSVMRAHVDFGSPHADEADAEAHADGDAGATPRDGVEPRSKEPAAAVSSRRAAASARRPGRPPHKRSTRGRAAGQRKGAGSTISKQLAARLPSKYRRHQASLERIGQLHRVLGQQPDGMSLAQIVRATSLSVLQVREFVNCLRRLGEVIQRKGRLGVRFLLKPKK